MSETYRRSRESFRRGADLRDAGQFPGVKEAAVIGRPDPRKGEQPVAFVAASEGAVLEEKALHHFLKRKLADYKVPKRIFIMPALPRNATGKILKTTLREIPEPELSQVTMA